MANKVIILPENAKDSAFYLLGTKFEKNAEFPKCNGIYVFTKDGWISKTESDYSTPIFKVNKKMNKCLKMGLFQKTIDINCYFFKSFIKIYSNTDDPERMDFNIVDEGLGVTHTLKVYNKGSFGLHLVTWPDCRSFYYHVREKKVESVSIAELKEKFFEAVNRATKEVYGKLPMGVYIIDNELKNMDKVQKERADAWLKIVNADFEKMGYKFKINWIK
ncbi:MAG: hypothetical protein J6V66_04795 [Clostridia bacterium]|nr:hypothetical protein [Clostridia bacterium]